MTWFACCSRTVSLRCLQLCHRGFGTRTGGAAIGATDLPLLAASLRRKCLSSDEMVKMIRPERCYHVSVTLLKRRKTDEEKKARNQIRHPPKPKKKSEVIIQVWKNMTVQQLADALEKDIDHVFEAMLFVDNAEAFDTPDAEIDNSTVISNIVKRCGQRCAIVSNPFTERRGADNLDAKRRPPPDPALMVKRPPVVTIMGHVDHGKTTLLDSLRHTAVVDQEFGGITQHIGAFSVRMPSGERVTFLDTPGHAAFYAMRARGAHVTDIIVLVVAADDGVMQQTAESIELAKNANVPIIVAINKIDKSNADIEHCKQGLLAQGIQLEEGGGDIQSVNISALKGTNLTTLIETIITQAELMELKADRRGLVEGFVIESSTDPGRGKLSTVLVNRGTLRKGSFLVAGTAWAKVRSMFDDNGQPINEATPGTPLEVIGWKDLPSAGDELLEVESERRAKEVVDWRTAQKMLQKQEEDKVAIDRKTEEHLKSYQEQLAQKKLEGRRRYRRKGPRTKEEIVTDSRPSVAVVLKGDVDGSVDAILDVLETFHSNQCRLDVIHYGVGPVTESDVNLASPFNGIVYAFNVPTLASAKRIMKDSNVTVRHFNIIYRLIEDVTSELNSKLPLKDQEQVLGEANVLQEFLINEGKKKWPVAGCICTKGVLKKSAQFRVIRGEEIVHEGMLSSMRHVKNEVDTINKDIECGLRLNDTEVRFQMGDTIVCLEKIKIPQKVDWDPGF